jgi:hypothetical protein
MEWDYWGHLADDTGAADMATVIIAIMAARPGSALARYSRKPSQPAPDERDRPHP